MVTAPMFIVMAFTAFGAWKWGGVSAGALLLGTMVGLTMASTALGAPILDFFEFASSSSLSTLSDLVGSAR